MKISGAEMPLKCSARVAALLLVMLTVAAAAGGTATLSAQEPALPAAPGGMPAAPDTDAAQEAQAAEQAADAQFVDQLRALDDAVQSNTAEAQGPPRPAVPDVLINGLPIFGRELFQRATSEFQAIVTGPVDPDYRLGPGDQVSLVLTGDVEAAYTLDVTREGDIIIPNVGQMVVSGLTLAELEERLYVRLGEVYSGIGRGAGATAHFQASVGRLRSNQVFIIGEVERPGAYQISSLSTVFNALYVAGGPGANGSMRRIEVRRGGSVIRTIDIYAYLLAGDSSDDIRLEQGDVIFVPLAGTQVSVKGAVRRQAVFEMDENDTLLDVLAYAGGTGVEAQLRRVQIDRILPPSQRQPGIDRVLVDVNLEDLFAAGGGVPVQDGDVVEVFSIGTERRNRLTVRGDVVRPGVYEFTPGMSLGMAIARAEGITGSAYTPRAHIYRVNPADGSRRLIQTTLDPAMIEGVVLADLDEVVVFSRAELRTPEEITIRGHVKNPGTFALAEGMTVRDLILAAGGFVDGADVQGVDVARRPDPTLRSDTTAIVYDVSLQPATSIGGASPYVPDWEPGADEFALQHNDQVFVRQAEGYVNLPPVTIAGEVVTPGTYVLQSRQERLLDILRRAGGATTEANLDGIRVVRGGHLVATDIRRAQNDPASQYNLVIEPGDQITLPAADPTVLVAGAVGFESRVLYEPGKDLGYYIGRAGGYRDDADRRRTSIQYQDGERAAIRQFLLFRRTPAVRPGSVIVVPQQRPEEEGFDWDQFLSRTLSIVSTTLTIIIAADRL